MKRWKWRLTLLGLVLVLSFLPALCGVTSPAAVSGFFLLAVAAGGTALLAGSALDSRAPRRFNGQDADSER